jgi:hypothetical protein
MESSVIVVLPDSVRVLRTASLHQLVMSVIHFVASRAKPEAVDVCDLNSLDQPFLKIAQDIERIAVPPTAI